MDKYIGTKIVSAEPATRIYGKVIQPDSWPVPIGSKPEAGYKVVYSDGYESWSPKKIFDEAYHKVSDGLTFGEAIQAMRSGNKVARRGWNGKGMWIVIMDALYLPPFNTADTARKVNDRTAKWIGEDKPLDSQPYIAMWTAKEQWQPGWLASQADMLSDDWCIID